MLAKSDGFDFGNGLEDLQVCHSLGNYKRLISNQIQCVENQREQVKGFI